LVGPLQKLEEGILFAFYCNAIGWLVSSLSDSYIINTNVEAEVSGDSRMPQLHQRHAAWTMLTNSTLQ